MNENYEELFEGKTEVTPIELANTLKVRIETVYKWLKHPTMPLPHRSTGYIGKKYFIKVEDIKDYFKLRKEYHQGEEE